jgi:hypothetical protein
VDGARQQLLAAAALADDEHGGVAVRGQPRALEHVEHRPRARLQPFEAHRLELVRRQELVGEVGRRVGGERRDQRQQAPRLERLGHVLDGAALERRHRRADRAVRGDEHRLGVRAALVEQLDERDAVARGQLQIGEHEVERLLAAALDCVLGRCRRHREVAVLLEELYERLDQVHVIVDHQHLDLPHREPPGVRQIASEGPLGKQALHTGNELLLDGPCADCAHALHTFIGAMCTKCNL